MTNVQLYSLIENAIIDTVSINREPTDVILTLSPACIQDVISKRLVVPDKVNDIPIRIAEKPARVNKPTGRYMISCLVGHKDGNGRRGRITLGELA